MLLTEAGMTTAFKEVQLWNVYSAIEDTPSGMTIDMREEQSWKA